ncbi:MAG: response regulator [Candidatus Omnitrophica bacterium]|nr:response regulator [Candidatus Omnitrophota bacterium]
MMAHRKQILIVEDETSLASLVKWHLESSGFEVHAEHAGKPALSYVAEHRPDLVILDLRLPDITGYEVCKQLRKLCHPWEVPILMLTAMDKPIDQLRGYAFGADAYMTKPFEPMELLKTVTLLLGEVTLA